MNNRKVLCIILTIILIITSSITSLAAQTGGDIYTAFKDNKDYFIIKPQNVPTDSSIILTCYQNDRFSGMYNSVYTGGNMVKFETNKSFDFDSLKLMVWEDMASFVPLCQAQSVSSTGKTTIKYMTDATTEFKFQNKYNNISALIIEDIPYKDGKIFGGWTSGSNENVVYQPGDVYSLNEPATLYAIWNSPATPTPEPTATPTPEPTLIPQYYEDYQDVVYDFGYLFNLDPVSQTVENGVTTYTYDLTNTSFISGTTFNRKKLRDSYVYKMHPYKGFVINARPGQNKNSFYLFNADLSLWVEIDPDIYFDKISRGEQVADPGVYYITIKIFYE